LASQGFWLDSGASASPSSVVGVIEHAVDVPPRAGRREDVMRVRAAGVRWLVRRSGVPAWIGQVLAEPDRFLADSNHLVADSPLITLGRIAPRNPGDPTLLLRRLNYGRIRHRVRDIFRPTRAERAFSHGIGLEEAGVATPRVLAAGAQRSLRWPVRAYLITEWVPDAITIRDLLERERRLPRELVCRLADLIAHLHEHGFSHRDLNLSNVLVTERFQPVLVDLDGVRKSQRPDEERAVSDLIRLAWEFVKYPRLLRWSGRRFLKRYCKQRQLEPVRRKLDAQISGPILRRLAAGMTYWKR